MINKKNIFIIAEISANHNQDKDFVLQTVKSIAKSGADAVKVQTYKPESLTLNMNTGYFRPRTNGIWKGKTSWDLYSKGSLPYEWHIEIQKLCKELDILFFSSPFDFEAVDFLETLNVPLYKVASLEITDLPLIEYIASKKKPIIISTGTAEVNDIHDAINICKNVGNKDITLLKCTSDYPADLQNANLKTLKDLKDRFNVKIGISDHTKGYIVPVTAVSFGISVIEKHFTLSKKIDSPDSSFSMDPDEFKLMVENVRKAEVAIGNISYHLSESDKLRRRSIFVISDIKKGDKFNFNNIRSIRPGHGISPRFFNDIIGKKSKINIKKGTPLSFEHIEDFSKKNKI